MMRKQQWTAILLICAIILGIFGGSAHAANPAVLDQQQLAGTGNTWVSASSPRYQSFTPSVSGNLASFELNSAGSYGSTGAMILKLYKENDLSTPIASQQLATFGDGWVSVDFSGSSVYLKRNIMYRMVVSTENGSPAGFGWYMIGGNPYPYGSSPAVGYDMAFKTYMIADEGLSADESKVSVDQTSIVADGMSQTTVRVRLKNAQGSDWPSGGNTVTITSTAGTVGPVTDNHDGTYMATLTAPVTTGTATVNAKLDGTSLASSASVSFIPGAPSAATSTIQTGSGTLTADGTSQTSVTVKLKDANGNALTAGGATVTIASTAGTVGAVTDNNNGMYSAVLTAPTTAGTATLSAKIGATPLTATAAVQFVPGVASASASTLTVADASLTADGVSHTTVTVRLKDAQANLLTAGGATVTIASTAGTVGAVTDNNNGTYSAVLTAPTAAGTATLSAKIGATPLTATAAVQFVPGAASAGASTLTVADASLIADGVSHTLVTVTLKDAQGNLLTAGGATVTIASTAGTVGAVTDNNNGTYSAVLTAPTAAGTATLSAKIGATPLTATAAVQFVPGVASAGASTLTVADASLIADGVSHTLVTVTLKDAQGNLLTAGGATVTIASTAGTVGAVTDNNNGTYSAVLTAPTAAGTATLSAKIGATPLTATAAVQFVSGVASASASTLTVADASLIADGVSHTLVSVTLKDAQGNLLTAGGATVTIAATLGTVGTVTDNHNGTYSADLTASTTIGTAYLSASAGGTALQGTASVQFDAGAVNAAQSSVSASSLSVRADGSSSAQIQVRLKDAYGHSLQGKRVLLTASGGHSVIDAVYGSISDADGLTTFLVSNTAAESVTYSATDEASHTLLDQTVSIAFSYDQPPTIGLQISPDAPTFGSVTVTVTAAVYGAFNEVAFIKWALGSQLLTYFDSHGETIADHFTVQANGSYSIYVADKAGNANVRQLEIDNIMPLSGNTDLSSWQLNGQGGVIPLTFQPGVTDYSIGVTNAVYGFNMTLIPTSVYATVYVNDAQMAAGSPTKSYPLAVGVNTFEITVIAQNNVSKTYTLKVTRDSESAGSEPTVPATSDKTVSIQLNGRELPGVGKLITDGNGVQTIEIRLNKEMIDKVTDWAAGAANNVLIVGVENSASRVDLRLTGEAAKALADRSAIVRLETRYGQYRLPMTALMESQQTSAGLTNESELEITIQHRQQEGFPDLLDAAGQNGFRLAADPIEFNVKINSNGVSTAITRFHQYIERIMYLPVDMADSASTVVVWDEAAGLRPVPTAFKQVNGRPAAVIQSLTNSVYVPIIKKVSLTDLQGHWAAAEIQDMNRRMIVNGLENDRFAPEKAITRAELAALIARALSLPVIDPATSSNYHDVNAASWYAGAIAAVQAYGLMDGVQEAAFAPEQRVSRQEAVVTLVRAMQLTPGALASTGSGEQRILSTYSDHAQIGNWAAGAIATAIKSGLIEGYGQELRPQQALTRAETAVLLYRMLNKAKLIQ
ncbi:invasin domain 3-containing protein [Paenibacillus ferrarius]|uniref:invasin domain 3-containing protein n=1 Tax=Paenibacillus ferrarius TaxID=1469647 RepID=UPI003D2C7652